MRSEIKYDKDTRKIKKLIHFSLFMKAT